MAPASSSPRSLLAGQASQPAKKELEATGVVCQRSCRGLLLYFPVKSGLSEAEAKRQSSLRAVEPICIGISSVYKAPEALDLKAAMDAHGLLNVKVDTAFILGHSVYQPSDKVRLSLCGVAGCCTVMGKRAPLHRGQITTYVTLCPSSFMNTHGLVKAKGLAVAILAHHMVWAERGCTV